MDDRIAIAVAAPSVAKSRPQSINQERAPKSTQKRFILASWLACHPKMFFSHGILGICTWPGCRKTPQVSIWN